MKKLLPLVVVLFVVAGIMACRSSQPLAIRNGPDQTNATTGTAGSSKVTDGPVSQSNSEIRLGKAKRDTVRVDTAR